jgi:hypothetical protein
MASVAAWAVALQALLSGFVHTVPVAFDPLLPICAAARSSQDSVPPRQHDHDQGACPAACGGGSPVLMTSAVMSSLVIFADRAEPRVQRVQARPTAPRHFPQAARGPPTAA